MEGNQQIPLQTMKCSITGSIGAQVGVGCNPVHLSPEHTILEYKSVARKQFYQSNRLTLNVH